MRTMGFKYISFDVFGTLIDRAMPLCQMYGLMGQVISRNKIAKIAKINNFTESRLQAEEDAKTKYGNNYSLREIYQSFLPKLSTKQIDELVSLEQRFELANSKVNQEGKSLYEKYRVKYKIIAVSDMYLDAETIGRMLSKNGYEIDQVFVSSEKGKSKREGDLYEEVVKELGVPKDEILHIGDAMRSDYLNAKRLGIHSRLLRRAKSDYYYDFGFKIFGPVMYSFCQWLKENIDENKDRKILFVSREGEIIRQFYSVLYGKEVGEIIYLSRKSILSGASSILLEKYNVSQLIKAVSLKRNETVGDFLKRLGLELSNYNEELKSNGIDKDNLLSSADIEKFFEANKEKILQELKKASVNFDQYLKDNLAEENLLIDIGWKGSMQDLLSKYLELIDSLKEIQGLYLGATNGQNKKGFLFSKNDELCQETLNYAGLLETILMPEHGSVLGYQRKNGKSKPIFDKNEFSDDSMEKIQKIQQGVASFISLMREFGRDLILNLEKSNQELNRFGNAPTLKDIKMLGGLDFYDNGKKYYLAKVEWRRLRGSFLDSKWKTAFLKQMLKIKLPYDKIVIGLRRVGDKND